MHSVAIPGRNSHGPLLAQPVDCRFISERSGFGALEKRPCRDDAPERCGPGTAMPSCEVPGKFFNVRNSSIDIGVQRVPGGWRKVKREF